MNLFFLLSFFFIIVRHKPWPRVTDFLLSLKHGSLVYDVGCGNAKYFSVNPNLLMVGCDSSSNLLAISKEKGMDSVVAEIQTLPFRSDSADHFICIAVLHHLSSESRRISALAELTRVLKPGGTGLIYVWAFEQSIGGNNSNYTSKSATFLPTNDSSKHPPLEQEVIIAEASNSESTTCKEEKKDFMDLPIHKNRTPFKQQDVSFYFAIFLGSAYCTQEIYIFFFFLLFYFRSSFLGNWLAQMNLSFDITMSSRRMS